MADPKRGPCTESHGPALINRIDVLCGALAEKDHHDSAVKGDQQDLGEWDDAEPEEKQRRSHQDRYGAEHQHDWIDECSKELESSTSGSDKDPDRPADHEPNKDIPESVEQERAVSDLAQTENPETWRIKKIGPYITDGIQRRDKPTSGKLAGCEPPDGKE